MRLRRWFGWVLGGVSAGCAPPPERVVDEAGWVAQLVDDALPPVAPPCGPGVAAVLGGVDYSDLQSALDAVAPMDTVWVCAGIHEGPFEVDASGGVQILGVTGDPGDVVLDGMDAGPVISQIPLRSCAFDVRSVTLTRGYLPGDHGAVIHHDGWARSMRLSNDIVSYSIAGTALYLGDSNPAIVDRSGFYDNECDTVIDYNAPYSTDYEFRGEHLDFAYNRGLALAVRASRDRTFAYNRRVTLRDIEVSRNIGGALLFNADGLTTTVRNVRIRDVQHEGSAIVEIINGTRFPMQVEVDNLSILRSASRDGMFRVSAPWPAPNTVDRVLLRDSVIARNTAEVTWMIPQGQLHPLLSMVTTADQTDLFLENVDLGTGPDANLYPDVALCPTDFGPGTSGRIASHRRDDCP